MDSPFKPLCMLGVFGVIGIVGALGAIGPMRLGITDFVWFRPPAEQQVITDEQRDLTDTQVTIDPERATLASGSVLSLGEEASTSSMKEIERLKASLDELSQLLQKKTALESELSRLDHLLEGKMTAGPSAETAGTSAGKIYEFESITKQTEAIKQLEGNLKAVTIARLESEVAQLKHTLEQKTMALSSAEEAAKKRERLIRELRATNQQQHEEIKQKTAALSSAEEAAKKRDRLIRELTATNQQQHEEIKQKTAALSNAEKAAAKREQLIHELTATNQRQHEEIKQKTVRRTSTDKEQISTLLPPTVNKADSISVAEVADLVRVLNSQIEQVSSLIMDSLESLSTGKELDVVWDELNDYIGSWLCNDLKRRSKELVVEPDPLIIQITLQTGLVNACSRIINDWNPPFWIDGLVFSRTYSSIEKTNGQAIADAWRALSRTHLTVSPSERQEANKRYLADVLLRLITAIGGSESGEILLSQYNEKVEDIVQKAVKLHKTVNEDVTSMELVTYTSPSDTPFDASQMEDTEGDESESQSGRVVCTVDMGLLCRKRDESGKKNGSTEEWGVTMKSRVVLTTTLDA